MNYQDDRKWLSQQLLFHKDNEYGSESTMEIQYSTQTTDFMSYGPPHFNIVLHTKNPVSLTKVISLNFQNASDLLLSLKKVFDSFQKGYPTSRGTFEIQKRYGKDRSLKIDFYLYNNNDKVCVIAIHNSPTDFIQVVFSFELFRCFCNMLKDFISHYFSIISNIQGMGQTFLLSRMLNEQGSMTNIMKSIPQVMAVEKENEAMTQEVLEASQRIEELDKFVGHDMSNIVITEVSEVTFKEHPSPKLDYGDGLVKTALQNNLKNLEDLVLSSFTAIDPITAIFERLSKDLNFTSDFVFCPGMDENETKSYHFLTKLLYMYKIHQFSLGKLGVPELRLLAYKPIGETQQNISLAYDLFTIFIYLRIFIQKLSKREANVYKNKIVFYTAFRIVFDMINISFIHSMDINKTKSCILERFNTYSGNGFFNEYSKLLSDFSIPEISSTDFSDLADNILTKFSQNPLKSIEEVHNSLYEKGKELEGIDLRIPFINSLNLEQILKILQIQLSFATGLFNDVKSDKILLTKKIFEVTGLDDEKLLGYVASLFVDKKVDVEKKGKIKESNLLRASKFYITDIPSNLQQQVLHYIESLGYEQFDYNEFSLQEFKDNIIKAIYVWNEGGEDIPYSDFMTKVENCIMSKDLILVKNKMVNSDPEEDSNYDLSSIG